MRHIKRKDVLCNVIKTVFNRGECKTKQKNNRIVLSHSLCVAILFLELVCIQHVLCIWFPMCVCRTCVRSINFFGWKKNQWNNLLYTTKYRTVRNDLNIYGQWICACFFLYDFIDWMSIFKRSIQWKIGATISL